MKYLYLFCFAALCAASCKKNSSQAPTPVLDAPAYRLFQGSMPGSDRSSILTKDGNIALVGASQSKNILFLRLSPTGNQLLLKEIQMNFDTNYTIRDLYSITQTNDDGYLLCGTAYRHNAADPDVCLVKLDSKGTPQWIRTYGGNKEDYGYQVVKTRDGNYVLCGISYSFTTEGYCDLYMLKVNDGGDVLWAKNYNKHEQQTPYHLLETRDGGYLLTGTDEPTGDGRVLYLLKVDANGNMLWDNTSGSANLTTGEWGFCSAECDNGDLMVCGLKNSKVLLMRTNSTGLQLWKNLYGMDSVNYYAVSMKARNGSFFITGGCNTYYNYVDNCYLLKVDESGTQQWLKRMEDSIRSSSASAIHITKGGDNILVGTQYLNLLGNNIFLTALDAKGNYK